MFGLRRAVAPILCLALVSPFAASTAASATPQDRGPRLERLLDKVNQVRARGCRCGIRWMPPIGPLRWNRRLARAADRHAEAMAEGRWFSHVGPGGSTLTSRAREAGYAGFAGGENIASGQPTVASVMAAWIASPGHCQNLMTRGYDHIGLGFAQRRDPGFSRPVTYWVQDFGYRD
ncbi:MAG: CAP domain-containing protein [Candidatus Nanopelagicales bacterium]|jgi:uncharacterized protein YkwD